MDTKTASRDFKELLIKSASKYFKGNIKGNKAVRIILASVPKRGLLFFSLWEQILFFRGDPFSKRTWCTGRQTGSHKSCLF